MQRPQKVAGHCETKRNVYETEVEANSDNSTHRSSNRTSNIDITTTVLNVCNNINESTSFNIKASMAVRITVTRTAKSALELPTTS